MNRRRSRTKFTEDQLKILIGAFNQKPYPGYATKRKLASEINAEESRIQIWFQNRRARYRPQRVSGPEKALESSREQDGAEKEIQSREDRRCRTSYTSSQLHTLIKAFMKNPYPGVDSREQLAQEIGVPESRVQVWFQNRRSRFHVQRKREAAEVSGQSQDGGQESLSNKELQPGKPLGAWPPAPPSDNMQHLPQKCTMQARPPERRAQAAEGRLPPEFLLSPDLYAH
nr:double homeobox protein A [Manis javanica]